MLVGALRCSRIVLLRELKPEVADLVVTSIIRMNAASCIQNNIFVSG